MPGPPRPVGFVGNDFIPAAVLMLGEHECAMLRMLHRAAYKYARAPPPPVCAKAAFAANEGCLSPGEEYAALLWGVPGSGVEIGPPYPLLGPPGVLTSWLVRGLASLLNLALGHGHEIELALPERTRGHFLGAEPSFGILYGFASRGHPDSGALGLIPDSLLPSVSLYY